MDYAIGVILLLTFFVLTWYCVKGFNLMIGFLIMTVLWTLLPLFGGGTGNTFVHILNRIYQSAPESWGTTLVNICWGT